MHINSGWWAVRKRENLMVAKYTFFTVSLESQIRVCNRFTWLKSELLGGQDISRMKSFVSSSVWACVRVMELMNGVDWNWMVGSSCSFRCSMTWLTVPYIHFVICYQSLQKFHGNQHGIPVIMAHQVWMVVWTADNWLDRGGSKGKDEGCIPTCL